MSPTDQALGAAGDERIVMHACSVEGQSSFATEGVIDGPGERAPGRNDRDDQLCQVEGQGVEVPGGMAEKAMEPAPMPVAYVATGEDHVGDIAATMREDPARDNGHEGQVRGAGEDGGEML